jgi:hypothetical protein
LISDAKEHQRLTDLYGTYSDSELLSLFSQSEDLTETAQEVLRSEISSRRLDRPQPDARTMEAPPFSNTDQVNRFALLSSGDCLWEFAESEDAQAAGEMLAEAGINFDLILPNAGDLDMGAPRLAVLPADAARAGQILSKPIPEEFRILVRTRDQYVLPKCPKCRSEDPLLESIDPANQWSCEVCGHTWTEESPL